jgi:hypothetical protein
MAFEVAWQAQRRFLWAKQVSGCLQRTTLITGGCPKVAQGKRTSEEDLKEAARRLAVYPEKMVTVQVTVPELVDNELPQKVFSPAPK